MTKEVLLNHVAVECVDQQSADLFFMTILGLPKTKTTQLSQELSSAIFSITTPVLIHYYDNGKTRIEVFIHQSKQARSYTHLCIKVPDKNSFVTRCKHYGLEPFFIEKERKKLLFVRDFSGNLFEVSEK